MNPLATKLQEAARRAAQILNADHHPHAVLLEKARFLQDTQEPLRLYMCLPVPQSKACVLLPQEDGGIPLEKLQYLSVEYGADKLIGYLNAAVADGSLPAVGQPQTMQEPGQPPFYRFAYKERSDAR